ncbi:hypothetical protein EAI_09089, partial [Harpegnathos saltator]
GFVAVDCGGMVIVSCYFSPNLEIDEYDVALGELADCVRSCSGSPIVVAGDFNARARIWGSNDTTQKAIHLMELMSALDLRLANMGTEPTCIRAQGTSVVDLTWATPGMLPRIRDWRVIPGEELEALSDHRYISFVV